MSFKTPARRAFSYSNPTKRSNFNRITVEADRLIEEIEARPGLYDKSLPEYSNKSIKESLWMNITESLIDDWNDISEVERRLNCKKLQFKWKHIRDNFRRELLAQKKSGGRRKRKYKFYDRMAFLTPHVSPFDENETQNDDGEEEDDEEDGETQTQIIIAEILDSPPTTIRPPPRKTYARYKGNTTNSVTPSIIRQRKKKATTEEEILKALKNKDALEADEDRTFCLSLVSSLKKMCNGTKLNAKIDILKVIRQYTIPQPYDSPAHSIDDSILQMNDIL